MKLVKIFFLELLIDFVGLIILSGIELVIYLEGKVNICFNVFLSFRKC